MIVSDIDKTMIGDGDAMCIAAQVAQDLLGTGKGLLAVDHPVELPERGKVGRKCLRLCQMSEIGEEVQTLPLVRCNELSQKHPPEQT